MEAVNALQRQQLDMEDGERCNEAKRFSPLSSSSSSAPSALSSPLYPDSSSDLEELQRMPLAPPRWKNQKRLTKQLSMCETPRDIAWEKRRRQILGKSCLGAMQEDITDEDLNELKGSIELGFGFEEKDGQKLCNTLPALDLYFAVNRQLSLSPVSTPPSQGLSSPASLGERSMSFESPRSDSDAWKICNPGDDPQHVKTKLRHWAQAVACSLMQSS
ncbi:uncharacterized protein LOC115743866 [Rhodamnia argentea]|uniref:Uncharacterized protein LOC115743866 n=1 Tax=Rhodamnia argentea TaxID=178133 RepID=A0ABM3HI93_9MYRT|nr:uncharacterized protein LOC115743866 [Rhodamnia argentea]